MAGLPQIPIERIYPNPRNVRLDLGDVSELAASIRAHGLLQPLVVQQTPKGWLILDGHRRYAAALLAGAQALPCIGVRASDEDHQDTVMLAAAMHKGLTPLEQAKAFRRLRERGLTVSQISKRTGYTPRTVGARLSLLSLPPEAQEMVADKTLTVAAATDLARQVKAEGRGETRVPTVQREAHFTAAHPLAGVVRQACSHLDTRQRVGVACGQCWEHAIREDEART